jgi:hypothetical protein
MASLKKRGKIYYAQYYVGGKERRKSLETENLQIAKAKLRKLEDSLQRGSPAPFPTKTPLPDILEAYAAHVRQNKTEKSAQTDIYYLREVFGEITPALTITSRNGKALSQGQKKRRQKRPQVDGRRRLHRIEAAHLEEITTVHISQFMASHVATRALAPKTANRYREILVRLFNWAMHADVRTGQRRAGRAKTG